MLNSPEWGSKLPEKKKTRAVAVTKEEIPGQTTYKLQCHIQAQCEEIH